MASQSQGESYIPRWPFAAEGMVWGFNTQEMEPPKGKVQKDHNTQTTLYTYSNKTLSILQGDDVRDDKLVIHKLGARYLCIFLQHIKTSFNLFLVGSMGYSSGKCECLVCIWFDRATIVFEGAA